MRPILTYSFFFAVLFYSAVSRAQSPKDNLNVPGPIVVDKQAHHLVWTAHPSAVFYKQEYIPKGDNVEKFKTMVLLDLSLGKTNIKDIVTAKISELKKMKETNPIVNYETFQRNGEYLVDFLLSANTADGRSMSIVERNVYRYKSITDKSGKKGVLLFAVSTRAYGNDIDKFLIDLKSTKPLLLNEVAQFAIPEITVLK